MAHKPVPGCRYYGERPGNPNARRIAVDVCVQIAPPREREAKSEISFERVRQMIYDWQDRGFQVKGGQVSFDGWQSLDSQQQLKRKGFRVAEFSLDRDTEGHDTLLGKATSSHERRTPCTLSARPPGGTRPWSICLSRRGLRVTSRGSVRCVVHHAQKRLGM